MFLFLTLNLYPCRYKFMFTCHRDENIILIEVNIFLRWMIIVKINVSIPEDFLAEIDRYKKIKKITRSQFIINAAKNYFNTIESLLAAERKKDAINRLKKTRQEIMELTSAKEINVVEELRKMRSERSKEIEKRVIEK